MDFIGNNTTIIKPLLMVLNWVRNWNFVFLVIHKDEKIRNKYKSNSVGSVHHSLSIINLSKVSVFERNY